MVRMKWLAIAALLATSAAVVAAETAASWDGLVEVKAKRMDAVFLMPGADFRPYTRLMVDPTQAAFKKDWLKSVNEDRRMSDRVTPEHAEKMLEAARTNFDDIFVEAFRKAGYEIVTTPGPDVLRVSTAVINLYVNAPDTMSAGRSYSYTMEAGEATLVIEVRDSMTGALMGRVLDRRMTRGAGRLQMTTSVSNQAEFRSLFRQWADIAAKGLDELKAQSPVPADLQPKQKL
jgi:hypothetical protein